MIEATDLEHWADRREAEHELPKLVRRLIRETVTDPRRVNFPAGEGVRLPGWDGIVDVTAGNGFVPDGHSGWELSTSKDLPGKPTRDFRNKTNQPLSLEPASSTFVFATPRRWDGKDSWLERKRASGSWAKVKALDARDLEEWLEQAPVTSSWFGSIIGRRVPGVQTLMDFWRSFAATTEPHLPAELLLVGRAKEVKEIREWLKGPTDVQVVEAESPQVAVAFVGALLESWEQGDLWRARALIVNNAEAWRSLSGRRSDLLVVLRTGESADAAAIAREGNHVLLPLGIGEHRGSSAFVLRRPPLQQFEEALIEMGVEPSRARTLSQGTGRSLIALRRTLANVPGLETPEWASPVVAREILPALLAGAWDEDERGDQSVLSCLAGCEYSELAAKLAPWTQGADAPLRRVKRVWKLTAPRDAWAMLAPHLTQEHLELFREAVTGVLGTTNPRLELPAESRWEASFRGKSFSHSTWLRQGLADNVALLAVVGPATAELLTYSPEGFSRAIVRDILADADGSRWYSVSSLLSTLAEASPDEFLSAVRLGLVGDDSPVLGLFVDEGWMGGCHHADLLWALEVLAWSPDYLGMVSRLLGALARLDPGGTYSNRPIESLRTVFMSWWPQTAAGASGRLKSLKMLAECEPDVGWELLTGLMDGGPNSFSPNYKPRWRDWSTREVPVTVGERRQYLGALLDLTLDEAHRRGDRWHDVVGRLASFDPQRRLKALESLRTFASESEDEEARFLLWGETRKLIHVVRLRPYERKAFTEQELESLTEIYSLLEPPDPVERFSWLFVMFPDLTEGEGGDWRADEERAQEARIEAVRAVWGEAGLSGIERLARDVERVDFVGEALADAIGDLETDSEILAVGLGSGDDALRELGLSYVARRRSQAGEDWQGLQIENSARQAWTTERLADFFGGLPPDMGIWGQIEDLGSDLKCAYWKNVPTWTWRFQCEDEVEYAVTQLLEAGRSARAVALLRRSDTKSVSSEVLACGLEHFASAPSSNELRALRYEVEALFEVLDERDDLEPARRLHLEWQYLPLLRHSTRGAKYLHRSLASDPSFFTEVIRWAYRRDDGAPEKEEGLTEEMFRNRAQTGYELLDSWAMIPGTSTSGEIDEAELREWVHTARSQSRELARLGPADCHIGQLLARALPDGEGNWPPLPVRQVLEDVSSGDLESGFTIDIYNSRGVNSRAIEEGGDQERGLEVAYQQAARAIAADWPQTSALLRQIAERFASDARRWDADAKERDL